MLVTDDPQIAERVRRMSLHGLSNVCTHRGNLLVSARGPAGGIRCGYHGRRFALDGRFLSMPRFSASTVTTAGCRLL